MPRFKTVPFAFACSDVTGGNPKVLTSDYMPEGALPVIDQGKEAIAGYVDDLGLAAKVTLPCILFGDHTRSFQFVDHAFALGADGVKVLLPTEHFDTKFLFHALQVVALPTDLGYSRHFKYLKRAFIPCPPLPEQRRIADILDRADALKRKRQQALQLADDFLRATFLDMFGDLRSNRRGLRTLPLGSLLGNLTSGSRGWAKYYSEEGSLFLRIQNCRDSQLDLQDVAFVRAPQNAEARRTMVEPGDVLLSITADIGRTAVVSNSCPTAYINQHLAILRPSKINSTYLGHFLASESGQAQFKRLTKGGVKAGLNFDDIRSLSILVPSDSDQAHFEKIVRTVAEVKQKTLQGLTSVDLLATSLRCALLHMEVNR